MPKQKPHLASDCVPLRLVEVMDALCAVGAEIAHVIARGPLGPSLGHEVGENSDGDGQKALDLIADEKFETALRATSVRYYASEEQEDVQELNPEGTLALAIDPLDGSSNIDVNVSIGTIFSIYEARETGEQSFLRLANEQIAAGYIIYGPQCCLVVSFGQGTQLYVLDPDDRVFRLAQDRLSIPETSNEFAINASNYRHWPKPIRAYVDDCLAGEDGPRDKNFNMRWIASLVAETHRILTRGGVFLYPSDSRPGYDNGRLRMVYECAPIAFVIEQAQGMATDGSDSILAQSAETLHGRTPLVFGSRDKVNRVAAYHNLPERETSALFSARGLFRGLADFHWPLGRSQGYEQKAPDHIGDRVVRSRDDDGQDDV